MSARFDTHNIEIDTSILGREEAVAFKLHCGLPRCYRRNKK